MKRAARRAFTLIEMLTVLAITGVLMTLIIIPVVQTFNLTRAAQGFSEAQNLARVLLDRISREIANSTGVRDNSGVRGAIEIVVPGQDGNPVRVFMPYTKLDIVKPAEGEPGRGPSGAYVNPSVGKEDPTLQSARGQVVLPVAPGATLARYWIGLRNPSQSYTNPYDGLLMARSGERDNLFVLFRAEVQPWIWDTGSASFQVNRQFFVDKAHMPNSTEGGPLLDDPSFFDPSVPLPIDPAFANLYPTKQQMVQNWRTRGVIQTGDTRHDMIQPIYNLATRQVEYLGNTPRLMSLVQFRPTRVSSEPAASASSVRQGEEAEGMDRFPPNVFQTQYGGWVTAYIRTWPQGWISADPNSNAYLVGRDEPSLPNSPSFIFAFDPDSGQNEISGGTALFALSGYDDAVARNLSYPFSRSLNTGVLGDIALRNLFIPYRVDTRSGRILSDFGINEVGNPNTPPPSDNPNNLPRIAAGAPVSPATETSSPGNFYDPGYDTINALHVWVWNNRPELRPNIHRFVDLRVSPNGDGTQSPLHPDPAIGFRRARIIPGSEVVVGPDQSPGPNFGNEVRYSRVTRNPGPNQYTINYVDLHEPEYSLLGLPDPPASYDPNDFMSAVFQPRFKAGYLQLNSDPNVPLPQGNVTVFYKFAMTDPNDVFAVDYDTRQVMSILLTIRNYPQTTLPNPQTITLRTNATVRNFLR